MAELKTSVLVDIVIARPSPGGPGRGRARCSFTPAMWHKWLARHNALPHVADAVPNQGDLRRREGIQEMRGRLAMYDLYSKKVIG